MRTSKAHFLLKQPLSCSKFCRLRLREQLKTAKNSVTSLLYTNSNPARTNFIVTGRNQYGFRFQNLCKIRPLMMLLSFVATIILVLFSIRQHMQCIYIFAFLNITILSSIVILVGNHKMVSNKILH